MTDVSQKFHSAVNVIKNLPKDGPYQPSRQLMLRFYSLYKQSTDGPCNITRPVFWDLVAKAKYDAWNSLGNMPKEESMNLYIDELKTVIETMPHSHEVNEFLQTLGSFYEVVDLKDGDSHDLEDEEADGNKFESGGIKIADLTTGFDKLTEQQTTKLKIDIDECSENSFYEVAPDFLDNFQASEVVQQLREDLLLVQEKVQILEARIRDQSSCLCHRRIYVPGTGISLSVLAALAGMTLTFGPLLWFMLGRLGSFGRRKRQLVRRLR